MPPISPQQLREILHYDPKTGGLTWKAYGSPQRVAKYAGKPAFTSVDSTGYRQGRVLGRKYYAHRVAYALTTGSWPEECVDHINGDRLDNRWSNLRAATLSQNGANRRKVRGASAFLGVHKHGSGRWAASVQKDGKREHLGLFSSEVEASRAYQTAAMRVHGEYASRL